MATGTSPQLANSPWLNPTWDIVETVNSRILSMSFVVVGTPKPKGRPRFVVNKNTGYTHTYTPEATVTWEGTIGWQAKQAMVWVDVSHPGEVAKFLPITGRISAVMRFNVVKPKSTPKSVEFPMKGADIDNYAKSVLDALQNVGLIKDDKTVTDLFAIKRWAEEGHPEGVEIDLTAWV